MDDPLATATWHFGGWLLIKAGKGFSLRQGKTERTDPREIRGHSKLPET